MNNRDIVYIIGAGRSGTTILGILLGDENDICHVGEINNFYKYNGIPPNDDINVIKNKYFKKIFNSLDNKNSNIIWKFEYHLNFIRSIFGLYSKKDKNDYKRLQTQLFDKFFETSKAQIIVDSTKYPSRLIVLDKYTQYNIYLIYIIRHPIGFLNSVEKKNIEQPNQSFLFSIIYYFAINLMCAIAFTRHKGKKIKLKYESLTSRPLKSIEEIEKSFNINLDIVKYKLNNNIPFNTGHIFDGNRIRLQNKIIFNTHTNNNYQFKIKNIVMMLFNRWFY